MDTMELEAEPDFSGHEAEQRRMRAHESLPAVVIGMLIGFGDEGATPLVLIPGQSSTGAIRARATIDVHGAHIGRKVLLLFENGDVALPIITGLVNQPNQWPRPDRPAQVEVHADGERLIVGATEQLVLRCGTASITLTSEGKVLIRGNFISSRSTGVNRIKGGSVQLN